MICFCFQSRNLQALEASLITTLSAPAPQPEPVFHFFGKLPKEIRFKIWQMTWEPRTVTMFPTDNKHYWHPQRKEENVLPASGYVNVESRSETLRYYKRCFVQPGREDFRWFNHRIDSLGIAFDWCLNTLKFVDPTDLWKVRRFVAPQQSGIFWSSKPVEATDPSVRAIEHFDVPVITDLLKKYWPQLKELVLTTNKWRIGLQWTPNGEAELPVLLFPPVPLCRRCHYMKTTYLSGLRVRYPRAGGQHDGDKSSGKLTEAELEFLKDQVISWLMEHGNRGREGICHD
ncbi:hypothetical protein GGR50DRAFT_37050 [Xylaria sp. CBS 124048]|nr:hypothetical protein GGR50DRAFT_37050 [Xylaria sp. CBS 124048]